MFMGGQPLGRSQQPSTNNVIKYAKKVATGYKEVKSILKGSNKAKNRVNNNKAKNRDNNNKAKNRDNNNKAKNRVNKGI